MNDELLIDMLIRRSDYELLSYCVHKARYARAKSCGSTVVGLTTIAQGEASMKLQTRPTPLQADRSFRGRIRRTWPMWRTKGIAALRILFGLIWAVNAWVQVATCVSKQHCADCHRSKRRATWTDPGLDLLLGP